MIYHSYHALEAHSDTMLIANFWNSSSFQLAQLLLVVVQLLLKHLYLSCGFHCLLLQVGF